MMINTNINDKHTIKIVEKFNLIFYSVFPDEPPISVTINLTKAEIAYNYSGSNYNKALKIHCD